MTQDDLLKIREALLNAEKVFALENTTVDKNALHTQIVEALTTVERIILER